MATRTPLYLDFENGEVKEFAASDVPAVYGVIPAGGSANQVLKKIDTDDYNVTWAAMAGGGDMLGANNLSDVANAATSRTNLGLGNVDNTSDANKPISTATQTALDGKVDENVAITGATKTKITYDAKGLVTAGADATKSDIGLGNVDNTSDATKQAATLLAAYPVGSIYLSVVSTNPNTFFGGTWVAFGTGRTLVGIDSGQTEFDTVEETGGAKTHTLSTAEMPAHTHTQDSHNHTQDSHNHTQNSHNHTQDAHTHTQDAHSHSIGSANDTSTVTGSGNIFAGNTASVTSASATATNQNTTATNQATTATNQATTATNQATTATNQNTGGGGAHNNLQPYIVVYMWKRTA